MPKKKKSKNSFKELQRAISDTSMVGMVGKMASEGLSPIPTKRKSLREAVTEVRKQSPLSPKQRLVSALQQASSLQDSVFMGDRFSKKVTDSFSQQDIKDLRLVYDAFDVDKSGFIDYDELRKGCKILGFNLTKDEITKMLADVDIDKSGQIDFNEFLEFVISRQGDERDIFSEIMQGFKLFDRNSSGKITFEDLKWVAKETGVVLTDSDLKGMIYEADKNGDNEIDQDEFISIMLQTNLFV